MESLFHNKFRHPLSTGNEFQYMPTKRNVKGRKGGNRRRRGKRGRSGADHDNGKVDEKGSMEKEEKKKKRN